MNLASNGQQQHRKPIIFLSITAFVAAFAMAWWMIDIGQLLFAWCLVLLIFAAFIFICGHFVTGRWLGALIDERNVMSLSRFQIVLWTLLVLSAYLVAVLHNMSLGLSEPMKIEIQDGLWWLMGISTTSLVGSTLILNDKTTKASEASEVSSTFELLKKQGDNESTLGTNGLIVVNTDISKARWSDMFTGEEVGNAAHLDMARLQMFFFTLITALAFAVLLGHMFFGEVAHGIPSLPALSNSMVTLIGISHAGYLTAKAGPHSQSASGQPAPQITPADTDEHPAVG